ncbi:MAG: energy transducer TonB [Kovacikia sp.]
MNSSGICTEQREREAKAFKSFLRVCLVCSVGLHAAGLTWVIRHQGGRSPVSQLQSQSVEVAVVTLPTPNSNSIQSESIQPGAGAEEPSSMETGAIGYLPVGDPDSQASSFQQLPHSPSSENGVEPLSSLPTDSGSSSLAGAKPEADRGVSSMPFFTSIPSLDPASPLVQPGLSPETASFSNSSSHSNSSSQQEPNPTPNDWLANLRNGLSSFINRTPGESSISARQGKASGMSSGKAAQSGMDSRSVGSNGKLGSPSAYGTGANRLGGAQSVGLNQGWGNLFGNSGNGMQRPVCVNCPDPVYPSMAQALGYTGTVETRANVDEQGNLTNVHVVDSSGHEILDRSTIEGVKKWLLNSTKGGYHDLKILTRYTKGGAQVFVENGSSPSRNLQKDRGLLPTASQSSPLTAPRNQSSGELRVQDLAPKSEPKPEPISREAGETTIDRPSPDSPSAPISQPPQAIVAPAPQSKPDLLPFPPEDNSSSSVSTLESSIVPSLSNKPATAR